MWGSRKWEPFPNTTAHSVAFPQEEKQPCWGDKKGRTFNTPHASPSSPTMALSPLVACGEAGLWYFRMFPLLQNLSL